MHSTFADLDLREKSLKGCGTVQPVMYKQPVQARAQRHEHAHENGIDILRDLNRKKSEMVDMRSLTWTAIATKPIGQRVPVETRGILHGPEEQIRPRGGKSIGITDQPQYPRM